jgi:hypothetical protein
MMLHWPVQPAGCWVQIPVGIRSRFLALTGQARLGRRCVLVFNSKNQVIPVLHPRVSLSILHGWQGSLRGRRLNPRRRAIALIHDLRLLCAEAEYD